MTLLRPWGYRLLLWALGAAAAGTVGFAAGAVITDRLEQDNRFCISCHRPDKPLHAKVYASFHPQEGKLPALAAAHNEKGKVNCIDCHIGAGAKDYLMVKWIAGLAAVKWLVGVYEDPQVLTYPLGDRTCLKCHTGGGQNPKVKEAFHNAPHHSERRNFCSDCHRSHVEASSETRFLVPTIVKPRCDACHQAILGLPAG